MNAKFVQQGFPPGKYDDAYLHERRHAPDVAGSADHPELNK